MIYATIIGLTLFASCVAGFLDKGSMAIWIATIGVIAGLAVFLGKKFYASSLPAKIKQFISTKKSSPSAQDGSLRRAITFWVVVVMAMAAIAYMYYRPPYRADKNPAVAQLPEKPGMHVERTLTFSEKYDSFKSIELGPGKYSIEPRETEIRFPKTEARYRQACDFTLTEKVEVYIMNRQGKEVYIFKADR